MVLPKFYVYFCLKIAILKNSRGGGGAAAAQPPSPLPHTPMPGYMKMMIVTVVDPEGGEQAHPT